MTYSAAHDIIYKAVPDHVKDIIEWYTTVAAEFYPSKFGSVLKYLNKDLSADISSSGIFYNNYCFITNYQ